MRKRAIKVGSGSQDVTSTQTFRVVNPECGEPQKDTRKSKLKRHQFSERRIEEKSTHQNNEKRYTGRTGGHLFN